LPWEAYATPSATLPATPAPAKAAPPQAPAPAGGADLYRKLIDRVRAEKGMLADFLEHGRLLQTGAGFLEIGFAPQDSFFLDTARETENLACIRAAARELLGGRAEVRLAAIEGEGGAEVARTAPRETDRHRNLRHEALNAEALGWAVEILQANVVEVKLDQ